MFKFAIAAAATIVVATAIGAQASVQRPAPGETRLKITCDLIQKNVEEGTNENTLHPRSFYYKVINRINSNMDRLSPPPAEYLCVTLNNEVLSVDDSGTDVILAQFPVEGETLTSFGLTPSVIKSIAIPNDIQDWPTTALNGCTNLEQITVYGPESCDGAITLRQSHNLQYFSNLTSIQLPSTVVSFASGAWTSDTNYRSIFPENLQRIQLGSGVKEMNSSENFGMCKSLTFVDFSKCTRLRKIGVETFYKCIQLKTVDLSSCTQLTEMLFNAFMDCFSLMSIVFPPSLMKIERDAFAQYTNRPRPIIPQLKTIIWKGRRERLPIVEEACPVFGISYIAFDGTSSLDKLVEDKVLTEIFID